MRLAIWQQFSSNHSGSFSIVGKFENPQAAEAAAVKVRDILRRLDEWNDNHEDDDSRGWGGEPSDVEAEILEELDLDWDVEFGFTPDSSGAVNVITFDDLLLLSVGETWNSDQHRVLKPIFEKLGARQTGMVGEIDGGILDLFLMKMWCKAPDDATADEIYTDTLAAINAIQTNTRLDKDIAWINLRDAWETRRAEIDRDGLKLYFTFQFDDPIENIPRLITGLRKKGCTDFAYDFYKIDVEG